MKKILLTGSNGFVGQHIAPLLKNANYTVSTLDIAHADIKTHLCSDVPLLNDTYDIILHAAGKAHAIPKTDAEKQEFFNVNYQGTVHVCKALEQSGLPASFIFISTVAVYGCELGEDISEDYPLSGDSPYALSKIQAETFLTAWCERNQVVLTILRPALLVGPNPPGNLGAMIRGIQSGLYVHIAGGKAKKSMLMVQDLANIVPFVAEKGGVYNLCDDTHPSFYQIAEIIARQTGKKQPLSIPYPLAKTVALCGDLFGSKAPINSAKLKKMTKSLTFSNRKAKESLNWQPLNVLDNFVL